MSTETKENTLSGFVRESGIKFYAEERDSNPNASGEWAATARHWLVTLHMGRRRMSVPFSTGSAHAEPTAEDILECLRSDSSSIYDGQTFEGWADEVGADTDSRSDERTYRICKRQTEKLRRFLGDALMIELSEVAE